MELIVSPTLKELGVTLSYHLVSFKNQDHQEKLWQELLNPLFQQLETGGVGQIKDDPQIIATKKVYRALGKDPARFRPSSDSLWRRVAQQKGLYQINDLVDLNNFFSLKYRIPFGSYDVTKIQSPITLTVGEAGETYLGIGKASVNIENLMVLTDESGPFGSPTADSTRGMIGEDTSEAIVIGYHFLADDFATIQKEIKEVLEAYLTEGHVIEQGIV